MPVKKRDKKPEWMGRDSKETQIQVWHLGNELGAGEEEGVSGCREVPRKPQPGQWGVPKPNVFLKEALVCRNGPALIEVSLWWGAAQGKCGMDTRLDQTGHSWSWQSISLPRAAGLSGAFSQLPHGWGHLIVLLNRAEVSKLLITFRIPHPKIKRLIGFWKSQW